MKQKLFFKAGFILILFLIFQKTAISQSINTSNNIDVFEMSLEDLMNQNVTTVSKSEEKLLDAPGIVSVLTKEDIKRFGGTTLSSVLERIPGVSATSAAVSDRSIVSMRGEQISSTSNHVLLLINGRPVREVLEGGVSSEMFESFPINCIERIEVVKGPGSVLYGSDAFSGVINIITQEVEQNEFEVAGTTSINGAKGAQASMKIKSGEFSLFAAGKYLNKPVWETEYSYLSNDLHINTGEMNNTTNSLEKSSGSNGDNTKPKTCEITSSISIPNESAGLFVTSSYKNISLMSSYNQWQTTGFDSPGIVTWKKSFSNLAYDKDFSEKWNTSFNVNYTNSQLEADSFPNIHRDSYELLAEWTNNVRLSNKSKLVFGGLYTFAKGKEVNRISDEHIGIEAQRYSFGVYGQADYQILEKVKFTGGLQLNKYEGIKAGLVPRVGMVWNPSKKINVKVLYGEAYRAPSLSELSLNQPFRQGNSELTPEKIGTFDFGINYQAEKFQLGLNYFHSKLNNIIVLDQSFTIPTYQNLGEVTFQGGELDAKYYLNKNIFMTGSALYQVNDNGNNNITPIPDFSAKGGINYKSNNGISLGLFNIYQGGLDESFASDLNVSSIKAYNKLDLNTIFDLNTLFKIRMKQQVSFSFQVDNLLDKEIWFSSWGDQCGSSIPFDQGRVVYAGLSIKF